VREHPLVVWGPELSPYLLKLEAMLVHAGLPFRRLPRDGGRITNLRTSRRIARATAAGTALRPPAGDPLDEYPLVPFLVDGRDVLYDSSALAPWIDARSHAAPLVPEDRALRWIARFLDEAFDELGLYMAHHNRWKLAAGNNLRPGVRLAREYGRLLPPLVGPLFARWFERRQVRRLPYLFSVAPAGHRVAGVAPAMTPPSIDGFPPTHDLLEECWQRTLSAMEQILRRQRYLFGGHFTVADASAYGQLSMNLTDGLAARRLRDLAPRTFGWLVSIKTGDHARSAGELSVSAPLAPLLELFSETFAPLMRSNEAAWERFRDQGATVFNEKAFDARECLYDGEMLGRPFRSVVKTFQVRVWRDLRDEWNALGPGERAEVAGAFGGLDPAPMFAQPEPARATADPSQPPAASPAASGVAR
jgi:glutathione S-transferase